MRVASLPSIHWFSQPIDLALAGAPLGWLLSRQRAAPLIRGLLQAALLPRPSAATA